jgi:transcriptional regulator with XRE-family HTH domain
MSDQDKSIGETVRIIRTQLGLTTKDLAVESGISESIISGVENLSISPVLGHIVSIAKALKVTVGELYGDSADSPFCLVRSHGGKKVSRFSSQGKSSSYTYESLGHQKQNRQMEPFHVTLNPVDVSKAEPNQHAGEEIIFVLTGQVQVSLAGNTDILNPGDSIYFDSNLPHVVACYGDEPATIFAVIYVEKEMIIF